MYREGTETLMEAFGNNYCTDYSLPVSACTFRGPFFNLCDLPLHYKFSSLL